MPGIATDFSSYPPYIPVAGFNSGPGQSMHEHDAVLARRAMLKSGLVLAGAMAVPAALSSAAPSITGRKLKGADLKPLTQPPAPVVKAELHSPRVIRPELFRKAMASLEKHGSAVRHRDRMAIVDFTAGSGKPRFHFVDLASGRTTSLLVSHGSGSDPAHTGYLRRFSNEYGSNASSEGAFATADYYVGKHGRSQRRIGLDATNCNALGRAIVIHSAWYANPSVVRERGVLGRSQGCFAVGEQDLDQVFARLGPGRMIYSAKV